MMTTTRPSKAPIPLWTIAFCGVLVGGMMALDGRADAQAPTTKQVVAKSSPGPKTHTNEPLPKTIEAPSPAPRIIPRPAAVAQPTGKPTPKPRIQSADKPTFKDSAENQKSAFGLKNILVLCLLVGLAGVAMFYAKRRKAGGARRQDRAMTVIETLRLAGRHQISLVQVHGRVLVVGSQEKGLSLLTELPIADTPAVEYVATPTQEPIRRPISSVTEDGRLVKDESDAFFNHLMDRIATAGAHVSEPSPPADTPMALKQRLQRYQLGPNVG